MDILRGEIFFVELGPTRSREIDAKRRPVVVLSINDINRKPLVISVIPGGTWKEGRSVFRHEVKVDPSDSNGLSSATVFQCFQVKSLDHGRFDREPIGVIDDEALSKIEETVKLCLGLP